MPRKRKNKARPITVYGYGQKWFHANVRRQRRRNEIAKASRRKNRGK